MVRWTQASRAIAICGVAWCSCYLAACGPTDCPEPGLLEDTPLPQLCLSDRLEISPARGVLAPREAGDGAGSAAEGVAADGAVPFSDTGSGPDAGVETKSVASGRLKLTVAGKDKTQRAREAAHVEVRLVDVDPDRPTPGVARLVPSRHCDQLSDSQLHCQLDVVGIAELQIEHLNRGGGLIDVCASSGELSVCSRIEVQGTSAIQMDLSTAAGTIASFGGPSDEPPTVACAPDLATVQPLDCWSGIRKVPVVARLISDEPSRGDAGVTTTVVRNATVILGGQAWREAFLSRSEACDPSTSMGQVVDLDFPIGSQEQDLTLCINRNGGSVELEGMLSSDGARTSKLTVRAKPMPAAVLPIELETGDGGVDDGFTLLKCDRSIIADAGAVTASSTMAEDGLRITLLDTDSNRNAECTIATAVTE